MTSSPLKQFFPALAGAILLGFVLYRMTSGTPATTSGSTSMEESSIPGIPAVMTVKCAHLPTTLSITCNNHVIWTSATPALEESIDCRLPLSGNAVNLTLTAQWPEGTPDTPITVTLEPEDREESSSTRWSFGSKLNDVYSFSWK